MLSLAIHVDLHSADPEMFMRNAYEHLDKSGFVYIDHDRTKLHAKKAFLSGGRGGSLAALSIFDRVDLDANYNVSKIVLHYTRSIIIAVPIFSATFFVVLQRLSFGERIVASGFLACCMYLLLLAQATLRTKILFRRLAQDMRRQSV